MVIPSHPRYEASSHGRIRSLFGSGQWGIKRKRDVPKILRQTVSKKHRYLQVTLGPWKGWAHIAICEAFHGPCPEGHQVAHSDGVRNNNNADNLSWKTQTENERDKRTHGTLLFGESAPWAILSEQSVREIKQSVLSQRQLALKYGVAASTIQNIKDGRSWKHVA